MRLVILNGVRYHLDCSQDYFHSVVPAIAADIQNMNSTQTGEQKWFNREDKWKISNRFGTVDVEVISPAIKKAEELKLQEDRAIYFPVPVFAMFDPEGYSYYGNYFDSFWVCLQQSWNPAVVINVDEENFLAAEIPIFTVVSGEEIFPLDKISEPDLADDDYPYTNINNDPDWEPGKVYLDIVEDFLSTEYPGPWGGPDIANSYVTGESYCIEYCDTHPEWCHISVDAIRTSGVDSDYSLLTWADGSDVYNVFWYAFAVEYGRLVGETTCDILRHTEIIDIYDYSYREYEWLPTQHLYEEDSGSQRTEISINGVSIYQEEYTYIQRTDFYMRPTRPELIQWGEINDSLYGIDSVLLSDCASYGNDNIPDYQFWCAVIEEDVFGNQHHEAIVPGLIYGSYYPNPNPADIVRNEFTYPYTLRIIIKIDSGETFTIYEHEFSHWTNYSDIISYCEIYNFFGEPVYIAAVSLQPGTDDSPRISKYAMIFKGNLILSDEFQNIPYTTFGSDWKSDIFGSLADRNLAGYIYAAAAGIKISKSSNVIIKEV